MQTSELNVEEAQLLPQNISITQQQQIRRIPQSLQPQFSVVEYCTRIQQEFQYLERQFSSMKVELQQLKEQKADIQDHYQRTQSAFLKLSQENHKITEMNNRLLKIMNSVLSELPLEVQSFVKEQLENTKKVISEEGNNHRQANSVITQQSVPFIKRANSSESIPKSDTQTEKKLKIGTQGSSFSELISGSPSVYPVIPKKDLGVNSGSEDEGTKVKRKAPIKAITSTQQTSIPSFNQNMNSGIPKTARMVSTLPHNEIVCAVAVNGDLNHVFTGGRGCVKLWDLNASTSKSAADMKCLNNSYIRSCKLANKNSSLVVAGETNTIALWDLQEGVPRLRSNLASSAQGYAVVVHDEEHMFYTCYSDGTIGAWDLKTGTQIRKFSGHSDGVSCIDMSPDGQKLITGGLDCSIRVWDINSGKELASYSFPSQIFSVGICPGESWVAVGLANSHVEVVNLLNSNCKYQLHLHESCVLSLKFANSGKWFITTGKDKLLNSWRSPFGASIFQCREPNSILCCDISGDDKTIVTGSGEQLATVYEVVY